MLNSLLYKQNLEDTLKRWEAFWQKEVIDRPIICATAPKRGMQQKYHNVWNTNVLKCKDTEDLDILLKSADEYFKTTAFHGEAIPYLNLDFGPDSYASFFGGEIFAPEDMFTTWVKPSVERWKDFKVELDKSASSKFNKLVKFMEYSANFSDGKFLMAMIDSHSGLDAMSALRGPQDLCFDFMDYPEEVEEALLGFRSYYNEIFNTFYKAGKMDERGCIGWAPTYSTKKFAVMQCDFSCLLSPEQGIKTFIPQIEAEAAFLDNSVYHYDGKEALCHLDNVLAIKDIDVIQWVPGDGQPRTIEWMDLLHKIQAAGKGLWIYDWTPEEIKHNFKELKPEGLVFSVNCRDEDEAEEMIEYVTKNF